mmetsp:Transcript_82657/g.267585  ORF Transcript_82657/g.267585 Transcript_82657/m.267585 type:complete len:238 (-) Transcript_82657:210-923(-)
MRWRPPRRAASGTPQHGLSSSCGAHSRGWTPSLGRRLEASRRSATSSWSASRAGTLAARAPRWRCGPRWKSWRGSGPGRRAFGRSSSGRGRSRRPCEEKRTPSNRRFSRSAGMLPPPVVPGSLLIFHTGASTAWTMSHRTGSDSLWVLVDLLSWPPTSRFRTSDRASASSLPRQIGSPRPPLPAWTRAASTFLAALPSLRALCMRSLWPWRGGRSSIAGAVPPKPTDCSPPCTTPRL